MVEEKNTPELIEDDMLPDYMALIESIPDVTIKEHRLHAYIAGYKKAVLTFKEWFEQNKGGVNLDSIRDYLKREIDSAKFPYHAARSSKHMTELHFQEGYMAGMFSISVRVDDLINPRIGNDMPDELYKPR